jgi:hypothetical protein
LSQVTLFHTVILYFFQTHFRTSPRLCVNIAGHLWGGLLALPAEHQAGISPAICCRDCLFNILLNYHNYLEAGTCMCNSRTHHATEKGPLNVEISATFIRNI